MSGGESVNGVPMDTLDILIVIVESMNWCFYLFTGIYGFIDCKYLIRMSKQRHQQIGIDQVKTTLTLHV